MSRPRRIRSDAEILGHAETVELLRAVAGGRVTRDGPGGFFEPYLLDGVELPRHRLRWLAGEDLVDMPMGGPPRLAPRAVLLLKLGSSDVL